MQGKQNMANMERKGPHKSMHCKFCKPPGVVTPEKPSRAQLETKTRIHLTHEAADLRLCNIHDEPGFPAIESEACACILEGENPCPKCVPDKTRPPPKKKVCTCPKGAKPHQSMYNVTTPKKKKQKEEDDEFWWEKYSREHDAIAKETWAAYMVHRRKERKLAKCQNHESQILKHQKGKKCPVWYQKLSCQQMIYVEFLSTAIRLDSDENITDRTYFVLGGIGLHPRPKKKLLKRCLRYCHYNAIQFLNQLHMLTKDEDPFKERWNGKFSVNLYTWNDRLIMSCMCYLEFPTLLREIMERLPPLPRKPILPQIPYPEFPQPLTRKYESPYEEPVWQDRLNWVEKMKIDRLNRCRAHMETKRVKVPFLALMRRPSLIDARPPFLAQIEANERASRRLVKEKEKKPFRKHPITTFNSAVDVTAIAGIEASEISTTDKADTDEICVFLRDPKEAESTAGELEEDPDFLLEKEVRFLEEPSKTEDTQVNRVKIFPDSEENSEGDTEADFPFKTPPKTKSGATIASPCPPPDSTPGPPATHFDKGRRELDIINEEICGFTPFVSSSTQTVKEDISDREDDVELKLKSAAAKLKEFAYKSHNERGKQPRKKKQKKCKKKEKCKKTRSKKKRKIYKSSKKIAVVEMSNLTGIELNNNEEEEDENDILDDMEEEVEEDEMKIRYKIWREKDTEESKRGSEISDPDPGTDDEWSMRPPCTPDANRLDERKKKTRRRRLKRKEKNLKKKPGRKKTSNKKKRMIELKEEKGEYLKKRKHEMKAENETMTAPHISNKAKKVKPSTKTDEKKDEREEKEVEREEFRGKVYPLVKQIIKDLAEEGFYCASYPNLNQHPDVHQLILYLKGIILHKELRESLLVKTKYKWSKMEGLKKFPIPDIGIPSKKILLMDWNHKKWLSRLAKTKLDRFYYKVANSRAQYGQELYNTLFQEYFGTDRYLKIFYAYMTSKYEDAILRGIV